MCHAGFRGRDRGRKLEFLPPLGTFLKQPPPQIPWSFTCLVGICTNWNAKRPTQAKICQFDSSIEINEEVLRFHVTVKHTTAMTEGNSL